MVGLYEVLRLFSWLFQVACTASEEDMDRNNIELKWLVQNKLYSTSGDHIEFRCKPGYLQDPSSSSFRVQCVEGTLKYPRCIPGSKSSPLRLCWSVVAFLVLKGSRKPLPFLAVSQGVGASWMLQERRGSAPKKSCMPQHTWAGERSLGVPTEHQSTVRSTG